LAIDYRTFIEQMHMTHFVMAKQFICVLVNRELSFYILKIVSKMHWIINDLKNNGFTQLFVHLFGSILKNSYIPSLLGQTNHRVRNCFSYFWSNCCRPIIQRNTC